MIYSVVIPDLAKRLINDLLARWYCFRGRYVESIAVGYEESRPRDCQLWACFRLGLYRSVVSAEPRFPHRKTIVAQAVAHAVCGSTAVAQKLVQQLLEEGCEERLLLELSRGLSPFLPVLALDLLKKIGVEKNPLLAGALLVRIGEFKVAEEFLRGSLTRNLSPDNAELALYLSNAERASPAMQLFRLNQFMAAFRLPQLSLIQEASALTPQNLRCKEDGLSVKGPLVTIIMTTYCAGERVVAAINSVLQQSYENIELIVVDDASTDNTPQLIRRCAQEDGRIKFIRMRRNMGTYAARNVGLCYASGRYVTCHDSDDWSHPAKLALQVAPLLKNKGIVASISYWVRVSDEGEFYSRSVYPLLRLNPSSLLFEREKVLGSIGIWECVRTGADSEFIARIKMHFGSAAVVRIVAPLSMGSHRADSLMNAPSTGYKEGRSVSRLSHWEAWNWRHIKAMQKKMRSMWSVRRRRMTNQGVFSAPLSTIVMNQICAAEEKCAERMTADQTEQAGLWWEEPV